MPLKVVNEEVPKIAAREEKWDLVTSMDVMVGRRSLIQPDTLLGSLKRCP